MCFPANRACHVSAIDPNGVIADQAAIETRGIELHCRTLAALLRVFNRSMESSISGMGQTEIAWPGAAVATSRS